MSNKNDFWDNIEESYPLYPTVRHRKRFVKWAALRYIKISPAGFIFDYGCGTGDILRELGSRLRLPDAQLGGSDLSAKSIAISKDKIKSPHFYKELYPKLPMPCDAIICSEVIEHAEDHRPILGWVADHLKKHGVFILSTQGGKMHKIDEYSGHIQTFDINALCKDLKQLGFKIIYKRKWGWPLFTLQKYLTDYRFESIMRGYLEGRPKMGKRMIFKFVYLVYFLHDLINQGPQLYIVAKK